ncbi:MAG: AAA family ATPase [Bdellovibrionales bacterium]|nr:AAA family ATPase [Bdellovibrionales bacterium]
MKTYFYTIILLCAFVHVGPVNAQSERQCSTSIFSPILDKNGQPMTLAPSAPTAEPSSKTVALATTVSVYSIKDIETTIQKNQTLQPEVLAIYKRMIEQGESRYVLMPNRLEALDQLVETMPNFKQVVDELKKSLAVSIHAQEAIHFPPIILLGSPGVGKTYFAEQLANSIGAGHEFVSMSSITAGWILSGASASWKGAQMGRVARTLIEKDTANPVIILDEIDKASGGRDYDPLGPLYQLLEYDTARRFRDEYLQIDVDASRINWVATANDISAVPDAIRSRALIFTIPNPDTPQLRVITANVLKQYLKKHPKLEFSGEIAESVFLMLKDQSPREIRKLIESGVGSALIRGRRNLETEDIDLGLLREEKVPEKRIGF